MRFLKLGRTHHLSIESASDLRHVLDLEEALWLATSAPLATFRMDPSFLAYLDKDNDGRVHASEIKESVRDLLRSLKDTSGIDGRSRELSLDALSDDNNGPALRDSIQKMLARLGAQTERKITLEQVRKVKAEINNYPISEGGVVLPEAAEDPRLYGFITDVLNSIGGTPHPSGKPGITGEQVSEFLTKTKAYLEWKAKGELGEEQEHSDILPLSHNTAKAYGIVRGLLEKIEQYYAQCEAVDFDEAFLAQMPPKDEDLKATDFKDVAAIEDLLKQAPLSRPRPDRSLDVKQEVNPYYRAEIDRLRKEVLEPLLGSRSDELTFEEWQKVRSIFKPYEDWLNAKPEPKLDLLDTQTLEGYMEPFYEQSVKELIGLSAETAIQLDKVRAVEKILLFQANILDFANNFVSFPDLYNPDERATFEMGSLVMDGRRFNMAVKVENRAEHSAVAQTSDTFIMYLQVAYKENKEPYEVAVPVTSGGKGNLVVGKRGIFQDVENREWDARVVQIIENPISLREAALAPFRKIGEMITGKIEQITASAGKKLETSTQETLSTVGTAPTATPSPTQAPVQSEPRVVMSGGLLAGGGLAIAALGSSLAYISNVIANKGIWLLVGGVGGALLAFLIPALLLAYIKLRRRDLSAILEGSGWAINARMRLTHQQSVYFTQRPEYPKGARIKRGWGRWWKVALVISVLLLIAWLLYQVCPVWDWSSPQ